MDVEVLREAMHKNPFEPFKVRMADGRILPVPHPDFIAAAPRRVVILAEDGSSSSLEPRLIASLDYDAPHSTPPQV